MTEQARRPAILGDSVLGLYGALRGSLFSFAPGSTGSGRITPVHTALLPSTKCPRNRSRKTMECERPFRYTPPSKWR